MTRAPERFQLHNKLGAGGTSVVYRAYDRIRDMPVALKELRRVEPRRLYAFKREFRSLSDLCHPNLVTLYELVCEGQRWFLTMELIAGGNFLSHVRPSRNPDLNKTFSGPVFATTSLVDLRTLITEVIRHSDDDEMLTIDVHDTTDPLPGNDETTLSSAATVPLDADMMQAAEAITIVEDRSADSESDDRADGASAGLDGEQGREPSSEESDVLTGDTGRVFGSISTSEPSAEPSQSKPLPTERRALGDILDLERFHSALRQLVGAVYALHHAGLVHRDLKPSNVLVTDAGRVVVVDFGIVAELGLPVGSSVFDVIAGTPAFMAPEQVRGETPSPATDWYAVGAVMYLCLTGQLPHTGTVVEIIRAKETLDPPPPSALVRGIPASLDSLCMALLARDPLARPTGAEILSQLGLTTSDITTLAGIPETQIFVGRDAQRQQLTDIANAVTGGETAMILVQGRSGMGKSTLVRHFVEQVQTAESALVFAGRCHDNESLAYRAWDGMIDELVIYLSGLARIDRAALIDEDMRPLGFAFPMLGSLPEFDVSGVDRPQSKDTMARAGVGLRRLLGALAATRPVFLTIDDLQWTDVESLHLMDAVFREPPPRLLVLATLRSDSQDETSAALLNDFLDRLDQAGLCHRVAVEPLSRAEQRQLMTEMARTLGVQELDDDIREQAGGHPMLLAELVRCAGEDADALRRLRQEQSSTGDPDGRLATSELGIDAVLRRRIAQLSPHARALLEAVAISTEPTPLSAAAQCARIPAGERARILGVLRSGQLARIAYRRREPWLDTHHSAIRAVVLDACSADRHTELHERMARALEHFEGAAGKIAPGRLADHWRSAGHIERAAPYLLSAADQAFAQLAIIRSVALYRQAIEAYSNSDDPSLCRAYLGLARGLRMGEGRGAELLAALALAQSLGERHELTAALGEIHYLRGSQLFVAADWEGSLDAQERAYHYGVSVGQPAIEARALSGMGDAHMLTGRWRPAKDCYGRCIERARSHKLVSIEEANLPMLAYMHWLFDELLEGLEACRRAAALARECGAVRARVLARALVAPTILLEMERVPEATAELDISLPLAAEFGLWGLWSHGMVHRGRCQWRNGQRDDAIATVERALESARETRMALSGPLCFGLLFRLSEDRDYRAQLRAEADELIAKGSGAISVISFCADMIEAGLERQELDMAAEYTELLATRFSAPPPWAEFTVARARALLRYHREPASESVRAELMRVRAIAQQTSRRAQVHALDRALVT